MRSYHFIPADNEQFIQKSLQLDCDVAIFDLEDSVAQKNKEIARRNIVQYIDRYKSVCIRINPISSNDFSLDIKTLQSISTKFTIILPKTANKQDVDTLNSTLGFQLNVIPLIEDFNSLANCEEIFSLNNVIAAGLGLEDMLADIPYSNEHLAPLINSIKMEFIKKSYASSIQPIDVISTNTNNSSLFKEECSQSRNMGFTGKLSIHPSQVSIINSVFNSSKEEIEWAENIIKHSDDESSGYKKHSDGILTTPPKIKKAKKILNNE